MNDPTKPRNLPEKPETDRHGEDGNNNNWNRPVPTKGLPFIESVLSLLVEHEQLSRGNVNKLG